MQTRRHRKCTLLAIQVLQALTLLSNTPGIVFLTTCQNAIPVRSRNRNLPGRSNFSPHREQPSAGLFPPLFLPAALTPTPGRSQPRSRVNTRPSLGSGFPASWERRVPPLGARSRPGCCRRHLGPLSPPRAPHLAPLPPGQRRTA